MVAVFKLCTAIVIMLGIVLNLLALNMISKLVKRYRIAERSQYVEKLVKKARISSKKMTIASRHVKKLRSTIFRTSVIQFLIPFTVFMISVIASVFIVNMITAHYIGKAFSNIVLGGCCIAPIPIEIPSKDFCIVSVVWIQFLVFLLFSPWYSYEVRKALERSKA